MRSKSAHIVTLFIVCLAARAHADKGVVVIGGAAPEHDRTTVRAAVEATAREAGWTLQSKPLGKKDTDALLNCRDATSPWTCVPAGLSEGGIERVFVVVVDNKQGDNGSPMVVLTGTVIATGSRAATVNQQYCQQCADDKLGQASTSLAQQLLRDLAVRTGRTVLSVRTVPPGAQVNLDATPVGISDGIFNTYPGKHVLVIEGPGYKRELQEVTVEDGKTTEVVVKLVPEPHEAPRQEPEQRSRILPAVIAGGGIVAVVVGTYLSFTTNDAASGPQPHYLYSGVGLGAAITGAAAVGVGALLWPRHTSSGPSVAVLPGGGIAGWATTF